MIFLTLGTQIPFDRLVRAVDEWRGARGDRGPEVFGQLPDPGTDGYRPVNFPFVGHLKPSDYQARVEACSIIVAHAGMGSIITAMTHAKPIVLMPRRASLREHRNEHQLATVARFGDRPGIHVAMETGDLAPLLDRLVDQAAEAPAPISPFAEPRLTDTLRAAILGQPLP
jgi:UDP-N-acetylglucosamine transferase subunit ALG13